MTLFDYYLQYMSELCEGRRSVPAGMTLTSADPVQRALELQQQAGDMAAFVRLCAAQDGTVIPQAVFDSFDPARLFVPDDPPADKPAGDETPPADDAPDPDAGKHAFEVLCDCVALDNGLVTYLIDVLKRDDRAGFYKLSQVTTHLDLDPQEFLYWLGHREDYAAEEERVCAVVMDQCLQRLLGNGQTELAAALLSGDEATFVRFRCDAPELMHLPQATFEWYCRNYLDRDYPLRAMMKWNGVVFPENKE